MGEPFKARMKRIRLRAGLSSQQAAADAIGCERGTVGMWEAPSSPVKSLGSEWLFSVARAYRVRPEWINDLDSTDDGYPWSPSPDISTGSPTETTASVPTAASVGEMPAGYVRLQLLDGAGGMGDGAENMDFPEVVREMDMSEMQLRNLIGFLPGPGRLKLMTGRGHSMDPVIKSGDVVLVDVGIRHFDGDGIYVLNTRFGTQIKALQNRGDGLWVVSANPTFPPFPADETLEIGGKVYVRNRFERLD